MKVLDFNLRTPGIFLQKKSTVEEGTSPKLTLEIYQKRGEPADYTSSEEEDWKDINECSEIKVLAEVPEVEDLKQENLKTQSLEVPYQNEDKKNYKLLVPDNRVWYYRIVASPCVECAELYRESVVDWETVKVLVGKGNFNS